MSTKISSTQITIHADVEVLRMHDRACINLNNVQYISIDNPEDVNATVLTWAAYKSEPIRVEIESLYSSKIMLDREGNAIESIPFLRKLTLAEVSTLFPNANEFCIWDVDDNGRHHICLTRKHPVLGWQRFSEAAGTWGPFNRLLGKEDQNIWLHPTLWKRKESINWDAVIETWYPDPEIAQVLQKANEDTETSE